ncbi:hypothetical protein [Hydrocarboniclastica marina]|uniref:Uncharacterized protein n=1 Tax=Hydrocarboniclastica marina TaxID=2259620 RepID=A0A4P7XL81_9ALTE|nr:hypothetical protein [Hydrocarboniclastica marina]QCF27603.1 hypothetical protein soil367_17670 [Hydrocarboniclastica marina]
MTKVMRFWLPVTTLIFGSLIGSGAIWSWKSSQIEQTKLQIQSVKTSVELRERMMTLLIEISAFQGDPGKRRSHFIEYEAKIEHYNALELHLANIEHRNPEPVDFIGQLPKPVKNFRIED